MTPDAALCFGTYNRFSWLQRSMASVRRSVGNLRYVCLIADGGSSDGSREWIARQPDCELLEGGLNGVVAAYNVAFARAIELEAEHPVIWNDDAEFIGPEPEIQGAVELLRIHPEVGFVNFMLDRYGKWEHLRIYDVCYGNYGVTRLGSAKAVARLQGDPDGKRFWDPRFHSYAADTAFGLSLMHLGWTVYEANDWRVHDPYATEDGEHDPLRVRNNKAYDQEQTRYFMERYGQRNFMSYNRKDAETYGGLIR